MQLLIIVTGVCLLLSFLGDRKKTLVGVQKGVIMFLRILPTILSVIIIISVLLYFIPEQKIAIWSGEESGTKGYLAAALIGSVSLLAFMQAGPLYGAFPVAVLLWNKRKIKKF